MIAKRSSGRKSGSSIGLANHSKIQIFKNPFGVKLNGFCFIEYLNS